MYNEYMFKPLNPEYVTKPFKPASAHLDINYDDLVVYRGQSPREQGSDASLPTLFSLHYEPYLRMDDKIDSCQPKYLTYITFPAPRE